MVGTGANNYGTLPGRSGLSGAISSLNARALQQDLHGTGTSRAEFPALQSNNTQRPQAGKHSGRPEDSFG